MKMHHFNLERFINGIFYPKSALDHKPPPPSPHSLAIQEEEEGRLSVKI